MPADPPPSAGPIAERLANARARLWNGDYAQSIELAVAVHRDASQQIEIAAEAALVLAMSHFNRGEAVTSLDWAERAIRDASAANRRDLQAIGWVVFGSSCALQERPVEAVQALDKGVALLDEATPKATICRVFTGIGLTYGSLGMPVQALEAQRQALAASDCPDIPDPVRLRIRVNMVYAAAGAHDLLKPIGDPRAADLLAEGLSYLPALAEDAARIGTSHAMKAYRHTAGMLLYRDGRLGEARALLRALADEELDDLPAFELEVLLDLALIERDAGRPEEVRTLVARIHALPALPETITRSPEHTRMLSTLADLEGDHARALALYKQYHARVTRNEHAAVEARLVEFETRSTTRTMLWEIADLRQRNAGLSHTFHQLESLARLDAVTGVLNRGALEAAFKSACGEGLALGMIDLDHFKRINDDFSHVVGDRVLRQVGLLMSEGLREQDLLGRYGGEEFAILLPAMTPSAAAKVAERLRARVEAHDWSRLAPGLRVTLSAGFVSVRPGESFESAVSRADILLYTAKSVGRNCICLDPVDLAD